MDIEIGSNLYQNCDGTIEIENIPQIEVAIPKPGGPLRISCVLYDESSRLVGKVVDSTLAFNERRAYELSRTPVSLLLKNVETGTVVLQVELQDSGRVVFKQGELLTVKGHVLKISPTEWRVEKRHSTGKTQDLKGKSVAIG